jgi:predicted nucleic acid-binding protein
VSGYLLDTNVVSELLRPEPNANVERFVASVERPLISAAAFHELAYGVDLLPDGARKFRLLRQIEAIQARFSGCTVAISSDVAALSGRLRARIQSRGGELKPMDALIGASAMSVAAILVTRNTKDFVDLGVELLNPWKP